MEIKSVKEMTSAGLAPVVGYNQSRFKNINPEDIDKIIEDQLDDFLDESAIAQDCSKSLMSDITDAFDGAGRSIYKIKSVFNKIYHTSVCSRDVHEMINLKNIFMGKLCRDREKMTLDYRPNISPLQALKLVSETDHTQHGRIYVAFDEVKGMCNIKTELPEFIKLGFFAFYGQDSFNMEGHGLDDYTYKLKREWHSIIKKAATLGEANLQKPTVRNMLLLLGLDLNDVKCEDGEFIYRGIHLSDMMKERERNILGFNYINDNIPSNIDLSEHAAMYFIYVGDIIYIITNGNRYVLKNGLIVKCTLRDDEYDAGGSNGNVMLLPKRAIDKIDKLLSTDGDFMFRSFGAYDINHESAKNLYSILCACNMASEEIISKTCILDIGKLLRDKHGDICNLADVVINLKAFMGSIIQSSDNMSFIHTNKIPITFNDHVREGWLLDEGIHFGRDNDEFLGNIKVDEDGAIIIKKREKADFMTHYSRSHKLLMEYHTNENYEGIKYELAKLWFMNNIIEQRYMHKKSMFTTEKKKQSAIKARAFILNDFKKYFKVVTEFEPGFNFDIYYNRTPFAKESIKINKRTIDTAKTLARILLFK